GGSPQGDSVEDRHTLKARVTGLSGDAVVADGRGGEVIVQGDGDYTIATLPGGTPYAATIARQPESQVCLLDEPDGVIADDVELRVDCADGIGLTLGTSNYFVAQLVLVDVPGEPAVVTAAIGGVPIDLVAHAGAFSFAMPDLAPGTHSL